MNSMTNKIKSYFKRNPVTAIIITINTVMLIITLVLGGFTTNNLVNLGGLVPAFVKQEGDYYRLLTSMFLHGSILHFFFNTYFIYFIGAFAEHLLGKLKYSIIYLVAGLGASLFILFLGEDLRITIGASGALFGILGGLFILTSVKPEWFAESTIRSIRITVVINLVFTFLLANISVLGHLGGFATGLVLTYFITSKNKTRKSSIKFSGQYDDDSNNITIDHDDYN